MNFTTSNDTTQYQEKIHFVANLNTLSGMQNISNQQQIELHCMFILSFLDMPQNFVYGNICPQYESLQQLKSNTRIRHRPVPPGFWDNPELDIPYSIRVSENWTANDPCTRVDRKWFWEKVGVGRVEELNVVDSALVWVVDCHVEWGCVDSSMLSTMKCQLMQRSVTDFTSQLHGLKIIVFQSVFTTLLAASKLKFY